MSITFNLNRVNVPASGAWDIATYMATPRICVESNHGASKRA
jgi:hypothetical protein